MKRTKRPVLGAFAHAGAPNIFGLDNIEQLFYYYDIKMHY